MKIAYLISAHNDPQQLARLVESLMPNAEFFIHIDAKVDITPFKKLLKQPQVHFLAHRISVEWGNLSEVDYQAALIQAYFESGVRCNRLFCLSGLDYPLWSNERMEEFWLKAQNKEYIQGIDMQLQPQHIRYGYEEYRYGGDWQINNAKIKMRLRTLLRKALSAVRIHKSLTFNVNGSDWHVFKGSAWWAVTPKLAQYMLKQWRTCPEIAQYFSTTFGPAELVWQTIAFNSPFAAQCIYTKGVYTTLYDLTPLHYIYYKPTIKVLDESDKSVLKQADKMFCRKTMTGKSDALLQWIDENRK